MSEQPQNTTPVRRIGMVAGEASGDLLASLLLKGLHAQLPADIAYNGIGGARMTEQGFQSNWPMHKLSVNGYVRFSYPALHAGNEVEDVRLVFQDGKVVEASASKGIDFLNAMLDMDAGSRYLGEVAFGTNYGIQRFTRELLFDEKIGGTMHMALGQAYGTVGGLNESGLHWDMVCIQRPDYGGGEIWFDGKLIRKNGKFLPKDLLPLNAR